MFPAIFLDRDGVIIENRAEYARDWSQVSIFSEAIQALSNSNLKSYKIIIVTNQSAVGRGIISLETAKEINKRLVDVIHEQNGRVAGVYLCPHGPDDDCDCRKPKPGLFLQAAEELSLDLKRSWMVGDAWSDIQAGQAAGVQGTIMVKTGRGAEQLLLPRPNDVRDHFICENLAQAFGIILAHDSGN
jgi:D-glycero-D-manno-heptose 1,7-bisphosphate phosphatase